MSEIVLAVALVGAMMLSARWPMREGLRALIGCFVLLGAPVIASGFIWQERAAPLLDVPLEVSRDLQPREELPPADYNPYAGA